MGKESGAGHPVRVSSEHVVACIYNGIRNAVDLKLLKNVKVSCTALHHLERLLVS